MRSLLRGTLAQREKREKNRREKDDVDERRGPRHHRIPTNTCNIFVAALAGQARWKLRAGGDARLRVVAQQLCTPRGNIRGVARVCVRVRARALVGQLVPPTAD